MSSDGNTVVAGVPNYNTDSGWVGVWKYSGGVWGSATQVPDPGLGTGTKLGLVVSISGDGNTVAMTAPYYNTNSGWIGSFSTPPPFTTPTVYTNMDFGLKYLPICSLSRHDVIIEIDFNQGLSPQVSSSNTLVSTLLLEYATVAQRELDWFTKTKQVYVYDSLIYKKFTINSGQNILKIYRVVNPVKEVYVTAQTSANATTYTYSTAISTIGLTFNGQDLINYSSDYWYLIEPFENKIVTPNRNVGLYVFKEPVNFSRIGEVVMTLTTPAGTGALNVVLYFVTKNIFIAENGLGTFLFK